MRVLPRLLFIFLVGTGVRVVGDDFAKYVQDDSFLFVEARSIPEYKARLDQVPALHPLREMEWKDLTLQLYKIASASLKDPDPKEEPLRFDDLEVILSAAEIRWKELCSHLNGDIAFSIGNFKDVLPVFRENAARRKILQETSYEEGLDGDEELSEAQMEILEARLEEESQMDMREAGSILDQFTVWIDVKEGEALEKMLADWISEILDDESEIQLVTSTENGAILYSLQAMDTKDSGPSINWSIQEGVWVITFTPNSLRSALKALSNPPENSLANQSAFQDAISYVGTTDFFMVGDIAPLDKLIRELMAGIPTTASAPIPFIGTLPTSEAVLEWLDLGATLPYVMGSRLEMGGVKSLGRYGFRRETALSRIMIDPEKVPAEVPTFIHRDFQQFASFNWHPGKGWSRLETELMGIAPQAAAGMGLLRMLASGQVGFDLKLQFMDHLNGSMVMVQQIDPEVVKKMISAAKNGNPADVMQTQMQHPTGGQNYLFAMGMDDEAAIRDAFDRLMTRFHPMGNPDPVLFEDQQLFYPIPEDFQGGNFHSLVSYSYLDGYFLIAIGNDTLLKEAIRASKDPALQLAEQADFQELQAKFLSEPGSIEYSSGQQQENAMELMEVSLRMLVSQHPDLELPDFSPLAEIMKHSLMVSERKGLVVEVEGWLEFNSGNE